MGRRAVLLVLISTAVALLACRRPAEASAAVVVEQEIAPWPARVGAATITFRMTDRNGKALSGATVMLEGNMSHAGMRPEFGEAKEIAEGRYQGQLAFTMAGDWVILMHVTLPGGHKLERQMEVKGVRGH